LPGVGALGAVALVFGAAAEPATPGAWVVVLVLVSVGAAEGVAGFDASVAIAKKEKAKVEAAAPPPALVP